MRPGAAARALDKETIESEWTPATPAGVIAPVPRGDRAGTA